MKRKIICLTLILLCLNLPLTILAEESNTESESEIESLYPLTSGSFYEGVMGIDSDMELMISESDYISVTKDIGESVEKTQVRDFIWECVQILKLPEMGTKYSKVSFSLLGTGCFEYFSISDFISLYNFSSTRIGSFSSDENVKSSFSSYYYAVFGGHDSSIVFEKEIYDLYEEMGLDGADYPEEYKNGYLWIFSNFSGLGVTCGYSINGSVISIEMLSADTEDRGYAARSFVSSVMNNFDVFYKADPDAMPYVKIQIVYYDITDMDRILWTYTVEKLNGSWTTTTNEGRGDFLTGLNKE